MAESLLKSAVVTAPEAIVIAVTSGLGILSGDQTLLDMFLFVSRTERCVGVHDRWVHPAPVGRRARVLEVV